MAVVKQRMTRLYAEHCGRTVEEVERTLDRDHFMTAQEGLDWGLVDTIISKRDGNPLQLTKD